jgi:hypothetical protein
MKLDGLADQLQDLYAGLSHRNAAWEVRHVRSQLVAPRSTTTMYRIIRRSRPSSGLPASARFPGYQPVRDSVRWEPD